MPDSPTVLAASLVPELGRRVERAVPQVAGSFPPERYIAELDAAAGYGGYQRVTASVRDACAQIEQRAGAAGLDLYHQLVLATLISHFDERRGRLNLPASVLAQFDIGFRRVLAQFGTNRPGFYRHGNDLFSKDLAICRGKLLPCGVMMVDILAGVPRRIVLCGGAGQLVQALAFFGIRVGGFRPLYAGHLERRALAEFTPQGFDRFYLRIADLLELNPGMKGLFGATWWFDPEVGRITPAIGYLRQRPLQGGARFFRVGSDETAIANATRFSPVRKELHRQGKYTPTNYLLAWARQDLLRWARRARSDGVEA